MLERLRELLRRLGRAFSGLTATQRIVFISAGLAVIAAIVTLIIVSPKEEPYAILYSGLTPEEASSIVEELKAENIPYRPSPDLSTIYVPRNKVLDLRLQMATKGLGLGAGVGYEIFDEKKFGVTEFQQKVNLLRARQGELTRTINKMDEVKLTRVHLSIPERTVFVEEEEKPRASVMLVLDRGKRLTKNQVRGIVHLISSSVENLEPENITIVDNHGNILSEEVEGAYGALTAIQMDIQRQTEADLERKIKSILAPIVGPDRVIARISAQLDFTRMEERKEDYDPERTALRSEQISSEKYEGGTQIPTGVPGIRGNIPPDQIPPVTPGGKTKYSKEKETLNYEITKTTSLTVKPIGDIKRLTVAVLVDGTYEWTEGEEGEEERVYIPRTEEELVGFDSLVKNAVGYQKARGDEVKVQSFPLKAITDIEDELRREEERMRKQEMIKEYFRMGLKGLATLVFLVGLIIAFFIINRYIKGKQEAEMARIRAEEEEAKEEGPPGILLEPGAYLRRTQDFARQDPKAAAELLRVLMKRGAK